MTKQSKNNTRLSKAEMRVVIAKDALAQLKSEKYVPESGIYIGYELQEQLNELADNDEQAQPYLKSADIVECRVCAKGALFLSAIRRFNKATVEDVTCERMEIAEDIFGKKQFDLIEAAFEQWDTTKETIDDEGTCVLGTPCEKAYEFGMEYDDDGERLVAILKNIINNKGTFKL